METIIAVGASTKRDLLADLDFPKSRRPIFLTKDNNLSQAKM
jgi:hypothetical protein